MAYSDAPNGDARTADEAWWRSFHDPQLDALVDTCLGNNLTIAQAVERIERAGLVLRRARALSKPQGDLSLDGKRSFEHEQRKEIDGDSGAERLQSGLTTLESSLSTLDAILHPANASTGASNVSGESTPNRTTRTYASPVASSLSLTWELDLWGRLRSEAGARGEEMAASMEDYEALRLLLSSQVADTYFQTLEQRLQYDLLMQQHDSGKTVLELMELRVLQGDASMVDVLQQRGQLADIEAEIPAVQAQLGLLENRLDVLLGRVPDGVNATGLNVSVLPVDSMPRSPGVPADLLQNRPDLRALQHRVVAADHRIASAIAERFPRITLDGSLGYEDTSSATTFTASAAASLLQPLWDWGQRQATVLEAQSTFREALLAYSQAYLVALEEVETVLWREARQRELLDALSRREAILRQTVTETRVRYGLGVTDYLPVLTAVQDLQDVQREILHQQYTLVSLRVELHRAVGGTVHPAADWSTEEEKEHPGKPEVHHGTDTVPG